MEQAAAAALPYFLLSTLVYHFLLPISAVAAEDYANASGLPVPPPTLLELYFMVLQHFEHLLGFPYLGLPPGGVFYYPPHPGRNMFPPPPPPNYLGDVDEDEFDFNVYQHFGAAPIDHPVGNMLPPPPPLNYLADFDEGEDFNIDQHFGAAPIDQPFADFQEFGHLFDDPGPDVEAQEAQGGEDPDAQEAHGGEDPGAQSEDSEAWDSESGVSSESD